MNDPYVVLGVSRDATDQQIKDAYRELAKKYHPDNFADNPLSDLAEDKMKEINEAYDAIMNERKGYGKSSTNNNYSSPELKEIRSLINMGRLEEAQSRLDSVGINERNAEWYFLSGSIQYKRGWFDNAYTNFSTACRMDPTNGEYRAALNQLQRRRSGYNPYNQNVGCANTGDCTGCDVCTGLCCADTCCECMGGDLIGCC